MITQLLQTIVYLAVYAVIVVVGWEEPLRYRFLSPEQIAEIERPAPGPVASQLPGSPGWRPRGTSLDRAPYETHNQGVEYTDNIDALKMGTRSEQDARANLYNGRGAR